MVGAWIRVVVVAGGVVACSDDASKIEYDAPPSETEETSDEEQVRQPGDDCNSGDGILDCDLDCWESDVTRLLGDGDCNQGEGGPNFDCAELDLDDGDCEDDGAEGTAGEETGGVTGGLGTGGLADAGVSSGGGTGDDADAGGTGTTGSGTSGSSTGGSSTGGSSTGGSSTGGSGAATGGGTGGTPPLGDGGTATPGMDCRTGYFFDCTLECVTDLYLGWVGDSFCDSPYPVDLDCEEFGFDGGDCLDPEPEPTPVVGESCGDDRVYDCSLTCVSESLATGWRGDGFCEDGTAYEGAYNLFCEAFAFDDGDCEEIDDEEVVVDDGEEEETPIEEPVVGAPCGADRVYDCALTCVDQSTAEAWAVDTFCDGEDAMYGYHLDCAFFGFDDFACDPDDDSGMF